MSTEAKELVERTIYGYKWFKGLEEWFDAEVPEINFIEVSNTKEYFKKIEEIPYTTVVLTVIPDEMSVDYDEDPYMPLKQEYASRGIPSQMVNFSTCRNLRDSPVVLYNIALNIYAKAGGIPWILAEPLQVDAAIGLDAGGGAAAATILYNWTNLNFTWETEANPSVREVLSLETLLTRLAEKIAEERSPSNIVFHKEGLFHPKEIQLLRKLVEDWKTQGLVEENFQYTVVEVKKKCVPRILREQGARYYNPVKGTCLILDKYKALVTTTGYPDKILYTAPVKPLIVEIADTSNWDTANILQYAKQVYWLSELHWGSGIFTSKYPITTLYAHRIIAFWIQGIHPTEQENTLWFL